MMDGATIFQGLINTGIEVDYTPGGTVTTQSAGYRVGFGYFITHFGVCFWL